jgi:fumarate reductase subunit D
MVRVECFRRELLAFLLAVLPLWCIKNYHNVHDFNGFIQRIHTNKSSAGKKVIYFNMHHTSSCVLLLLVALAMYENGQSLMHLFKKKQQQKNSLACKKMEIRIPDNALEKTSISAEGRAFFVCCLSRNKTN